MIKIDDEYIHKCVGNFLKKVLDRQNMNSFPKCSHRCDIVKLLGVGECENVCPGKFTK